MADQTEALRLADAIEAAMAERNKPTWGEIVKAATELRRQHAEIENLRDSLRWMAKRFETERDALLEALRMVKEAAIEMRGDDFNLTAEQWAKVHAAIAKAEGGGNG